MAMLPPPRSSTSKTSHFDAEVRVHRKPSSPSSAQNLCFFISFNVTWLPRPATMNQAEKGGLPWSHVTVLSASLKGTVQNRPLAARSATVLPRKVYKGSRVMDIQVSCMLSNWISSPSWSRASKRGNWKPLRTEPLGKVVLLTNTRRLWTGKAPGGKETSQGLGPRPLPELANGREASATMARQRSGGNGGAGIDLHGGATANCHGNHHHTTATSMCH
mmetsp:Transcript_119844/g.298995  ORF Transcript_119844/g.298995 Transcript_119844/m.298995 type:complete len:218 (+) Transcript_119844:911-1564(+)